MNTSDIISKLGGTAKTAELCEVTPGAVSQWIEHGIPPARLMYLKLARPDVFADEVTPTKKKHSRRSTDPKESKILKESS